MNSRKTWVELSIGALKHNLQEVRAANTTAQEFICPMVKADAYGHGAVQIAKMLEDLGVKSLGVISIEEAIELRENGIKAQILTYGSFDSHFAKEVFEYNLTPVVSDQSVLETLRKHIASKPLRVHLKFNTGMNRLGFSCEKAIEIKESLGKSFHVEGILTHFLNGEDADAAEGYSQRQLSEFSKIERVFEDLNPIVHYYNSAALAVGLKLNSEAVLSKKTGVGARPGISIYGYNGTDKKSKLSLRPVLSIKTRLEAIQYVHKNQAVSYGPRFSTTRNSVIGVLPIGYADGVIRGLTNRFSVLYRGKRAPVVGTVCMDYCMVDLTDNVANQKPQVGETITVIGHDGSESLSIKDWSDAVSTIPYEPLTRLGRRLTRTVVK